MNTLSNQNGSSLFMILIAVAMFAALSYVISQQNSGVTSLANEKIRLLASDVIDMGNKLADSVARVRLTKVPNTKISFENGSVAGYTNATCSVDTCKIFAFDGGGRDWETPSIDINGGKDWGFTGNLAIQNIGTTSADLVALLPDLSLDVCNRINVMVGAYASGGTPSTIAAITANKFTGTYGATAVNDAQISGQKSSCFRITTASGTAFSGAPLSNTYVFYQVLEAR